MEETTAKSSDTFIERVRLQGYKSIEDVEITLKPGLNILIGGNGSGKTNFVKFLDLVLNKDYINNVGKFAAEIGFKESNKRFDYYLNYEHLHHGFTKSEDEIWEKVKVDGSKEFNLSIRNYPTPMQIRDWDFVWRNLRSISVSYGVPESFNNINTIDKVEVIKSQRRSIDPPSAFIRIEPSVGHKGLYSLIYLVFEPVINLPTSGNNRFEPIIPKNFIENLRLHSPIKNIRIEERFQVDATKEDKEILHVRFEFFIDGKWRPWTHLSDGTKRLVYIITEVTFANNIVLLEEPELGIHPHQLSKLMDFLEAAAEHKQIIITTHSPQVLNVLPLDELDRIIIVRYEKDKGTQMSHLTGEEQQQARTYMEAGGLDLSDYWVHSNLERETEAV